MRRAGSRKLHTLLVQSKVRIMSTRYVHPFSGHSFWSQAVDPWMRGDFFVLLQKKEKEEKKGRAVEYLAFGGFGSKSCYRRDSRSHGNKNESCPMNRGSKVVRTEYMCPNGLSKGKDHRLKPGRQGHPAAWSQCRCICDAVSRQNR